MGVRAGTPTVAMELDAAASRAGAFPPEVEMILSALEAGVTQPDNRRKHPRMPYRVLADLRLFSDAPGTPPWRIYTRDVSARGVGFITAHRLPLGYGGTVEIPAPATGNIITINCTLFRCRELSGNGWFEGALYFNREQWIFSPRT